MAKTYAPHCYKRLRRHNFRKRNILMGDHRWKKCIDCGWMRITHHVSCNKACWGAPG